MHYMFLSCRKATELIEKKLLIGLSAKEKVQLMFHTSMCDACKKYSKQSHELDDLIRHHIENFIPEKSDLRPIASEFKEKIVNSLEKKE